MSGSSSYTAEITPIKSSHAPTMAFATRMPACLDKSLASSHRVKGTTTSRRNAGVVRATPQRSQSANAGDSKGVVGRRDGVLMGLVSSAIIARPARAGLFGGISEDVYVNDTGVVLGALKQTLELTSESQNREDTVANVREEANKWVAKYRRQSKFSGRPSYGNTYSAINAVLGHYNNFGASTLFPKRRLERVVKEVDDAGRALTRGR